MDTISIYIPLSVATRRALQFTAIAMAASEAFGAVVVAGEVTLDAEDDVVAAPDHVVMIIVFPHRVRPWMVEDVVSLTKAAMRLESVLVEVNGRVETM